MRETTAEEHTKTASAADNDRDLKNFPLLQTRAAIALRARSRTARVLLEGSPAFRLLMFGSSISMLGTRISTVAFPMLVLHLNNSPFVTGLVACAAIAPSMLFYVPAGVLVDRWNPRRVMLISEFARGLTIASIVFALIIFGTHVSIWFLILAMLVEEILEIFSTLADRRYLNRVMESDKIASRQASIEVRVHAVVLAGRPIGPFLFSIDPFLPFLADAASFVVSGFSLALLRRIDEPQGEVRRLSLREMTGDIVKGFRWLKNDHRARVTILLMAMTSMVAQALILMFLVEAHSDQLSTLQIGVVLAASGAGGAVGSFGSRIVPTVMLNSWLPIQMIAWSVALVFLALVGGQSVYLSAGAMFILGLTGAIGNVEFGTYLASNVDDDMIAKVTGIGQMLAIGACALGPVLGGYAIQHFRVKGAILMLFIIVILLAVASSLMPEERRRVARVFRRIKQLILDGGHALRANHKVLKPMTAFTLYVGPEQDQDDGNGAISYGGPILLPNENGRPLSSVDRKPLTCGDAGK